MNDDRKFIDENGNSLRNDNKEVITIKDRIEYVNKLIEEYKRKIGFRIKIITLYRMRGILIIV